jgi:hypothetical protein
VWSRRSMRRYAGTGAAVLHDDDERRHARRVAGGHRPLGACLGGRHVVEQFMVKGKRGGQGSRTVPVAIEDPALVPMSEAERAAAVSVLVEILTDWWARHGGEDRSNGAERRSAKSGTDLAPRRARAAARHDFVGQLAVERAQNGFVANHRGGEPCQVTCDS